MIRSLRNIWRLLRVARILARHDALFPLEELDIAPGVAALARMLAGPPKVAENGKEAAGRPEGRRSGLS